MSARLLALVSAVFLLTLPKGFAQSDPPPFVRIARGADATHTVAIGTDGSLWTWGSYGLSPVYDAPTRLGSDTQWQAAASGGTHALAVKTDGTVWSWGGNSYGQIGDGTTGFSDFRSSPVQIGSDTHWQAVAAGNLHSVALKSDGTLWAWGSNFYGQLGDGSQTQRNSPVQVGTDSDWLAIAAGGNHTLALKSNGSLWAWGENADGQLGDGSTDDRTAPVQVGSGVNWSFIVAGTDHSVALQSDGSLWAWGSNGAAQLGDGSYTSRSSPVKIGTDTDWSTVAAGRLQTLALKSGGNLWGWGDNIYGQLGDGTFAPHSSPVQISSASDWQAIATGSSGTRGLRGDGSVWCWGSDSSAQLAAHSQPVSLDAALGQQPVLSAAAGFNHSAAVKSDGTLWTWGSNTYGELGNGTSGSFESRSSPVQVGTANDWAMVAAHSGRTMAIKSNGSLWAWGGNSNGALGDGSLVDRSSPVRIGTATNWRSVACGFYHTVGLRTNGTLWVWGGNYYSQLGDGTQTNRASPFQLAGTNWSAVAAGWYHTVALKSDGTLWAWGYNDYGQVGDGTIPVHGATSPTRRVSPVQIGTATNWVAIAAGDYHTLALKSDGTLWAWGHNGGSQLGIPGAPYRYVPTQVGSATDWQAIAAGFSHGLAVKTDGTLWGWGRNYEGQLAREGRGYFTTPLLLDATPGWSLLKTGTCMNHTILTRGGRLWGFGSNLSGQLPGGDMGRVAPRRAAPSRLVQTVSLPGFSAAVGVPVTLTATAGSGLPVSYSVSGPATLDGNTFTRTGPGEVRLDAWQSGNDGEWRHSPVASVLVTLPLTPLEQWKLAQLGDANAPDLGDPDGDGLVTLLEYGLVLSPASPSVVPAVTLSAYPEGERLRITVQRDPARDDVALVVQAGDSLAGPWSDVASSAPGAPFSGPGYVGGDDAGPGVKTVEVRDTVNLADAPRRFMRVKVTRGGAP